jgi:proteic killer suppression protein
MPSAGVVACRPEEAQPPEPGQGAPGLGGPPGSRLEALNRDDAGFVSIRVNDQVRIVFRFENGDARQVRIVDYH